jgi:hypothetical protein
MIVGVVSRIEGAVSLAMFFLIVCLVSGWDAGTPVAAVFSLVLLAALFVRMMVRKSRGQSGTRRGVGSQPPPNSRSGHAFSGGPDRLLPAGEGGSRRPPVRRFAGSRRAAVPLLHARVEALRRGD